MKPNNKTHFYTFEDAFYRVPYFAEVLQVYKVPIILEDDGTFQYFGCGRKVYEYELPQEEIV